MIQHWIALRVNGVPIRFGEAAGMALRGTLDGPHENRSGRSLRVDYGHGSEAELRRLVSALPESGTVYVRSAGTERWVSVASPTRDR
nr:MAG: hypothetical protein DIU58_17680 [Sphaerobacter thermophilus]